MRAKPQPGNNPQGDKMPETEYYHDAGTSGLKPPPDVDAYAESARDDVIDWSPDTEPKARVRTYQELVAESVPVRVMDIAEKTKTTRHTIVVHSVGSGETVRILSKDPTRTRALIKVTLQSAPNSFIYITSEQNFQSIYQGFPLRNDAFSGEQFETFSEEEFALYNNTANGVNVHVYAEYARPDSSRIERYYGSVNDGRD